MQLHNLRILRSPNIWAPVPVLQVELELIDRPNMAEANGLGDQLRCWLPNLACHRGQASSDPWGQIERSFHPAHLLLDLTLELQIQTGCAVEMGLVQEGLPGSFARVVVEYEEAELGKACLHVRTRCCWQHAIGDHTICRPS